jgi:hypothetical protein
MTSRIVQLALLGLIATSTIAGAQTRLFTVASRLGMICEVNPLTGVELDSFPTPGIGDVPGLAFNGRELFYTDETLAVIKVYTPAGVPLRDLPRPGANPIMGLGVSATALFALELGTVWVLDPSDGRVRSSFGLPGAKFASTFAASRGTLFVRIGDLRSVLEVAPSGMLLKTMTVPDNYGGLAYSASARTLFAATDGRLSALDPDTGAMRPGYPVQVTGPGGLPVDKTGALAADEVDPDGEICGNCIDDDGNGATDLEDPACCPVPDPLRVIRVRLKPATASGPSALRLRAALPGFGATDPAAQDAQLQLRSGAQELLCATIPSGRWKRRRSGRFWLPRAAEEPIALGSLRPTPAGDVWIDVANPRGQLGGIVGETLEVRVSLAGRCAPATVRLRRRGKRVAHP